MRTVVLLIILICSAQLLTGQVRERLRTTTGKIFFEQTEKNTFSIRRKFLMNDSTGHENPRIVAIVLDITLGVLGMHRLYLGTDLKVPVFYALTLGGGGILWLVDLGMLIAAKDIQKFMDNPKLFMWAE